MSNDLTFGVKLTARAARCAVKLCPTREEFICVKKSTDDLAVSSGKMARPTVEFGAAAKNAALSAGQ